MFLVAGLGNPGQEYLDTRHNVGHMVIDHISNLLQVTLQNTPSGKIAEAKIGDRKIILAKLASFVNTSGPAVKEIMRKYGVLPDKFIVIHDDLDLAFAKLRVRQDGSSGGHRGIDSLITTLATDKFCRVKIGIGRPPGRMDPADFVLSPFAPEEWPEMEVAIAEAAEAAISIINKETA